MDLRPPLTSYKCFAILIIAPKYLSFKHKSRLVTWGTGRFDVASRDNDGLDVLYVQHMRYTGELYDPLLFVKLILRTGFLMGRYVAD